MLAFLNHMTAGGGQNPDPLRKPCQWCFERSYPEGRKGEGGFSPSYIKSHLSALRFLYQHVAWEDDLPTVDPTAHIKAPKIVHEFQYAPTPDDVRRLLDAPRSPMGRLASFHLYYAPERRAPVAAARWRDFDLDAGTWTLVGKNGKADVFPLHPVLIAELRRYRSWQRSLAEKHESISRALANPETAYVYLTRNGRPINPGTLNRVLRWRAIPADVAVVPARSRWDSPGGKTSLLSPHALRRAWAIHALNDPTNPVPIDVVSTALRHADISTTRRHYAPTKPERARQAIITRTL